MVIFLYEFLNGQKFVINISPIQLVKNLCLPNYFNNVGSQKQFAKNLLQLYVRKKWNQFYKTLYRYKVLCLKIIL